MFHKPRERINTRQSYTAILVGIVVSSIVTYQANVTGINLWVTAFLSTLLAATAFLIGVLILNRSQ